MIKKVITFFRDPQKKVYINDVLTRILLYGISFVEILLLPVLFDANTYAEFEYLKNAIFLFPMVLIGGHSGYTYLYYRENIDGYDSLFKVGLLISTIASFILAFFYQNPYIILPCIGISLFTIIEQKLKIKKRFVLAFLFKPLLSLLTIGVAGLYFYIFRNILSTNIIISVVFGATTLIWLTLIYTQDRELIFFGRSDDKKNFAQYTVFVRRIFTGVMASIILSGFFFLERFYIKKFYESELPDYSFSFNLVQLLIILITTLSYISGNLLGENLYTIKKATLVKTFKILCGGFVFLVGGLIIFSFGMNVFFFPNFENMVIYTTILGIGKGFVFLVGILTPLAVYNDFNDRMMISIGILFVLSNIAAYGCNTFDFSVVDYLIINALILLIYPLSNLDIIFRKIPFNKI